MSKYTAVIVTYFPDTQAIENLERVSTLCDKVIVVDNTPTDIMIPIPQLPNITIRKSQGNVGLAAALNQGIQLAGQQGFENIFLFDQDSRPPDDFFKNMLSFKSRMDSQVNNCAVYVPNFYDRNSNTFAKFPVLRRFNLTHATCTDTASGLHKDAILAITSGSLITCSRYKEIGPLRDDYFIDFIDNEYCLRIDRLGLRIAVNCDVVLDHAIGKRSIHRFCGLTIKPNNHLPLRRYYISRNGVRTTIDYFSLYPCYLSLILARMIHELFSIVLYEDKKPEKIKALFCGIYHGLIGRMGKCQIRSLISSQRQM